jgi:hypothetical protein
MQRVAKFAAQHPEEAGRCPVSGKAWQRVPVFSGPHESDLEPIAPVCDLPDDGEQFPDARCSAFPVLTPGVRVENLGSVCRVGWLALKFLD